MSLVGGRRRYGGRRRWIGGRIKYIYTGQNNKEDLMITLIT